TSQRIVNNEQMPLLYPSLRPQSEAPPDIHPYTILKTFHQLVMCRIRFRQLGRLFEQAYARSLDAERLTKNVGSTDGDASSFRIEVLDLELKVMKLSMELEPLVQRAAAIEREVIAGGYSREQFVKEYSRRHKV
ncbi:MAG: hypothetical protein Q9181_004828, partial [Wetmoreana brouardii]